MEQRILLIEDNPDITRVVQYELEQAGYRVVTAPDGITGLTSARESTPDLVILDLGLPDFDGAEIARRLRKTSSVPIIILTAMDAIDRKVNLLEAGADDYMTKPFHPEELVARVKVQLRHQQHGEVINIGALEIHPQKRLCSYNGHEVRLSPKEFDLLTFLARQPGRVYSRQEIEREVWNGELPSNSNVVDVHMANMRAKLRDLDGYGIIRTVRGIGYALKTP
ncbi:two component transcriptional regulator, winged helix family [Deinococcus reticulitermitis]|uniref:Two component transcriptional regulator, winged helix family n=1 Tax=Deinococcus reticulitermitis TaxID=856736 RepID=A0A1H6XEE6_9DEIO|nr:response regulator transcription factor [Deinococcus reticulitermitis]SEJ23260.1 two component transcriptional regulator, winged helix family [Deinococcus reticulitermitis]